jgi:hypothetical protein
LATGPVIALPFISPLGFTMTPALSCAWGKVSECRQSLACCVLLRGLVLKGGLM